MRRLTVLGLAAALLAAACGESGPEDLRRERYEASKASAEEGHLLLRRQRPDRARESFKRAYGHAKVALLAEGRDSPPGSTHSCATVPRTT